jgi:SAM-dependent methyltransferase
LRDASLPALCGTMFAREARLAELVRAMATGPRHEAVRGHITEFLRTGFGAAYEEIAHEVYLRDNSGRIDMLWGAVVIEIKTDLRHELDAVLARMPDYLAEANARALGRPATGLATDGSAFIAYTLKGGALTELTRFIVDPERPGDLVAWLEPLLSERPDLAPEPRTVAQHFGRGSSTFFRAKLALDQLWAALREEPEIRLKRELWDGLLREAYGGESVGGDVLFLQHTYLTSVVKAIAARVLDLPVDDAASVLSGSALAEAGIFGAVEADFFDWPLKDPRGAALVRLIAKQVARFRLRDVEADVLKILYESLVDPDDRKTMGEYYTPDWLAFRVVAAAIDRPLEQRVLDPACGSGTFLFHAIRRLIAAGQEAGWSEDRIRAACAAQVRGLDVHPVAVTLARVTWLLALGALAQNRTERLDVPVFLGDAMQWGLIRYLDRPYVEVEAPGEAPLRIPAGFAEDQALFERALDALAQGLRDDATIAAMQARLLRLAGADPAEAAALAETYGRLLNLYRSGRNGIWVFVLRNLVRPVWLSRPEQRAEVLVGNPPWIVYRHLSAGMKDRVPDALRDYGLWVGGNLATQQDLCALFWARGAERYLAQGGRIGFVLPYAVLNAPVFAALRAGRLRRVDVRLTGAWALERVWPIFGAQSGASTTSTCVVFGERDAVGDPPAEVDRWVGRLARRDASEFEATLALVRSREAWPRARTLVGASPYRARFRQGATVVPRRFFVVDPEPVGRLGGNRAAPRMRGRAGKLDKAPWTRVEVPSGPVEARFLRPLLLGETITPYRLLEPVTAVIPLEGATLLDAAAARDAGHPHLASWLRDIEAKWAEHGAKNAAGAPRMTLSQRIDYMRNLSAQATEAAIRIAYTKAGTRLSAAQIANAGAIVDHKAYWAAARSADEARYLLAILNSAAVLAKITDLQPHGQRDKRDFDNLVWTLPIPDYDPAEPLHRDLAAIAARAEALAATVDLAPHRHFTAKRRAIRAALAESGIAAEIESLVDALLPP